MKVIEILIFRVFVRWGRLTRMTRAQKAQTRTELFSLTFQKTALRGL